MKANPKEAAELGDFLGNTAKSAMIGKIIAAPLKYAGDAWTKFSLANPNYYVPAEFGSAVSKIDYLDEVVSGQLTTTSSRVAAQTTAAKLRKEIILESGMDKSEILKFFGDGDDILAIIDEMDNVVGRVTEGGVKSLDDIIKISKPLEKEMLPNWIGESFSDGKYITVETAEDLIVYRAYGGTATSSGAFVTTYDSITASEIVDKLALLPEWGNTVENVATIRIPAGTKINIGLVEEQLTEAGAKLAGGATQILMPQDWPPEWIISNVQTK